MMRYVVLLFCLMVSAPAQAQLPADPSTMSCEDATTRTTMAMHQSGRLANGGDQCAAAEVAERALPFAERMAAQCTGDAQIYARTAIAAMRVMIVRTGGRC